MKKEKIIKFIKSITVDDWSLGAMWLFTLFTFVCAVEAIFFTPLEMWAWGFRNDKLDMTMILSLAGMVFWQGRKIKQLEKK